MAAPSTRHVRGDRLMFLSIDDNATKKLILATHAPDGTFIVAPLLKIIEDIMHKANPDASHQGNFAELDLITESEIFDDINEILEVMSLTISKVSREVKVSFGPSIFLRSTVLIVNISTTLQISWKCVRGADAHTITMEIFNLLSNYEWDAKAVIILAAFALNYGEFWLVAQLYTVDRLAKSVAHLKQLPDILELGDVLKPLFENINKLIKAMLELTRCILRFPELPKQYINPKAPELVKAAALIPTAVYWIVRSIVGCVSILTSLTETGHEHMITMTTKAWELSSLAYKVSNFHAQLKHLLDLCDNHISEMENNTEYAMIIRGMETPHLDNLKALKHLFLFKDDQLPLYESSTKKQVSMDILKKKTVLLLISSLDLFFEELLVLESIYKQDPTRLDGQYEVLWIPVVPIHRRPWTDESQSKFDALRNMMPWYSVFHPSLLEPAVIKYIKEVWHFNQKPLLVVMDPQGRIVNTNALHMMWIWGSLAFPFTSLREEALWKEETWRIELLADSIEPMIFNWIAEGRYICLYGGEDIEWIRTFTSTARAVARTAGIPLEMLYVGKSNPREKVRKINNIIRAEKLSYLLDLTLIWFFWVRLESMLHSKLQCGKSFDEDTILGEINVMLSYDGNDQGWAVICQGSNNWMRRANGEAVLTTLNNYKEWEDKAKERGFLWALNENLDANRPPHHCNSLILPGTTGSEPDRVVCAECGRSMERFFLYRCSTD